MLKIYSSMIHSMLNSYHSWALKFSLVGGLWSVSFLGRHCSLSISLVPYLKICKKAALLAPAVNLKITKSLVCIHSGNSRHQWAIKNKWSLASNPTIGVRNCGPTKESKTPLSPQPARSAQQPLQAPAPRTKPSLNFKMNEKLCTQVSGGKEQIYISFISLAYQSRIS